MKFFYVLCMLSLSFLLYSCTFIKNPNAWHVMSPDGALDVTVELVQEGGETSLASVGSLQYSVKYGANTVIAPSPLGLECADESFTQKLVFQSQTTQQINETYTLHNSKRSQLINKANELTLTFANENDAKIAVILRAYDDGLGIRYAFPEGAGDKVITREATGFKVPAGNAFIMPYDNPSMWTPAYENYYDKYEVGVSSPTDAGWAFPSLFQINEGKNYVLLTESGLNGSYCGTRLEKDAPDGLYRVRFPLAADGEGTGTVTPTVSLPWLSSWKVIIVGDSPGDIVESSLVTHLADAPAYPVADYVKPGRASWSWWSDSNSPRNFAKQKTFIDLSAAMGWEYYLLDANWNFEPTEDLLDFVNYANQKGVGMLMWYNSGGPHNIVTEAPRDRMYEKERRRQEFEWLREIGVKGVKVDFWQSDKQEIIQYYIDLLHDANDFGILVNFHGCTIPRGWERTYPNMLTLESVRGAECYKFAREYPQKAVWHNVNLVFTRNAIGPMDFTPVTFTDMENPHLTTNGHELALSVVFQSGILHFGDKPEGYYAQPDAVQQFLKNVPVVWDEIKFLAGEPGKFVVLARRSGETWYIAGINGQSEEQTVAVDLSQFGAGQALFIGDKAAREFDIQMLSGAQQIKMLPFGGFVIKM